MCVCVCVCVCVSGGVVCRHWVSGGVRDHSLRTVCEPPLQVPDLHHIPGLCIQCTCTHVYIYMYMYMLFTCIHVHVHVHVVHSEDPVICECLLNDVDSFSVRLHSTLWDDHIKINLHIPVHEHVCMTCTCTCKMHFSSCPSTANEAWDWPKCILHSW